MPVTSTTKAAPTPGGEAPTVVTGPVAAATLPAFDGSTADPVTEPVPEPVAELVPDGRVRVLDSRTGCGSGSDRSSHHPATAIKATVIKAAMVT